MRSWLEMRRQEGATLATHFSQSSVETFGKSDVEYEHLTRAVGCLVHSDRGVLEVRGERAPQMVTGLISNDLAALSTGKAVYAFVLTPKGHPVAEVRVLPHPETVRLDTPAACLTGLLEHFGRYIPPLYARFGLLQDMVRLSVVGPRAAEACDRLRNVAPWAAELPALDSLEPLETVPLAYPAGSRGREAAQAPQDQERSNRRGPDLLFVCREEIAGPGFDLYSRAGDVEELWQLIRQTAAGCGGGAAGRRAHEIWRVERGIPAYGYDITAENLPQETGQESRAISYEKGCYTGQEIVARIHYRGHVNRRLRGLSFTGTAVESDELPRAGQALYRDGRPAGQVTTPVQSPHLGPIALGYVRSDVAPGEILSLDPNAAPAARVESLPFTCT